MTAVLAGRTAVVTGAAHGIGRATADLLAQHGAAVVLADVDGPAVELAAGQVRRQYDVPALAFSGDLTDAEVPLRLVEAAWEATGTLDLIVNAAGYNLNATAMSMADDSWQRMLDIHVTTPFRLLRAAGPYLQKSFERDVAAGRESFRKVVNVSSIAVMGSAGQAGYAAGKAALVGLTKSLAKEWAAMRVNVNAVAFGSIDTRLTQPRSPANKGDVGGLEVQFGLSPRVIEGAVADIPFGRLGTTQEAAGGVFLLCTPWSDWVTGQLLVVSGGQVFGMSA